MDIQTVTATSAAKSVTWADSSLSVSDNLLEEDCETHTTSKFKECYLDGFTQSISDTESNDDTNKGEDGCSETNYRMGKSSRLPADHFFIQKDSFLKQLAYSESGPDSETEVRLSVRPKSAAPFVGQKMMTRAASAQPYDQKLTLSPASSISKISYDEIRHQPELIRLRQRLQQEQQQVSSCLSYAMLLVLNKVSKIRTW